VAAFTPFIAPSSSFPSSTWGRGCHNMAKEGDSYSLQSSVVLVYAEQWRRSTGVGGGKLTSSSGALHRPPYFYRGGGNNHCAALCRHDRGWSPTCRGSVDGTPSSGLILSPTQDCAELAQIWFLPSRGTPREEVFWPLAVLSPFSS
jgi:hypothetical protein